MKKFIRYVVLSSLLSTTMIFLFVRYFAEYRLKTFIEEKASKAVSGPVTMNKVQIGFWPPFSLTMDQVHLKKSLPDLDVLIPTASISMDMKDILKARVIFRVALNEPVVNLDIPPIPPQKNLPPGETTKIVLTPSKQRLLVGLNLIMNKAAIKVVKGGKNYSLSNLDVDFLAPTVGAPWNLKLGTEINLESPFKMTVPAKLSSQFLFDGDVFESKNVSLELGGIAMQFQGRTVLSTEDHKWDGLVDIADLKNFIIPPEMLSILKDWSGSLKVSVHGEHVSNTPWRVQGSLTAQNLAVEADIYKPEGKIQGRILTDSSVEFSYQESLVFNKLNSTFDLSDCLITSSQFSKPKGTLLKAVIAAEGNHDFFNLTQGQLSLSKINLMAHGRIDSRPEGQSDLSINIPSTQVNGLEQLFPALASTPLTGRVELQGNIKGDLQNPKNLAININPLTFENVKGTVLWSSDDKSESVKGTVTADGRLVLVAQGQKISQATLNLSSDLTQLGIFAKNVFKKEPNIPLRLNLKAVQRGQALQISEGEFLTSAGLFQLTGKIQDPSNPKIDLRLTIPKLDLTNLSKLSPILEEWKLGGMGQGQFHLSGVYDLKGGIQKSPLNLSGVASLNIPHFVYSAIKSHSEKISEAENPRVTAVLPPEGLLPDWPLMRALNLDAKLIVGSLDYQKLVIQGLSGSAIIKNGTLTGRMDIRKVFDGNVRADKIETDLLKPLAPVSTNISFNHIDLTQALTWGAPQWKDTVKGKASFQANVRMASQKDKNFIGNSSLVGHGEIKNGFLSTISFDQYLNEKLSHVPGLGSKKLVNTKGTAMDVTSQFDFSHGQLVVKNLDALTPEKNELQVTGFIKLDKTMDLKGKAMLTASVLPADVVACNADKTGRMIIPIRVTGTASNPEYNLADGTLQQVIAQTASCQTQKIKDQVKNKLQDEAKKSILDFMGH